MVTREKESQIRDVFREAMQSACEDLAARDILSVWWPDGFAERLAEMVTQSVAMMAESCEMAEEEVARQRSAAPGTKGQA